MIGQTFNRQEYVALRPLSKGVDRETPPQMLEVGAFRDVANCDVRRGGLRRRGGYAPFVKGLPSIDDRVYGSPIYYDSGGNPVSTIFTRKHLWKLADGNELILLSMRLYEDLTADVTESSLGPQYYDVTVTGETFTTDGTVSTGDTVWIGGVDGGTPYEIVDVDGETTLVVKDHDGSLSGGTDVTVDIIEAFRGTPDWVVTEDALVFTDNSNRGLLSYDGTSVEVYNAGQSPVLTGIATITSVGYRLWIGGMTEGMTEGGTDERYRIRWTTVTDLTEFPTSQFVDLPRGRSDLMRLLPLGNLLVAYFRERIFFGRPTNIVNLPYDFTIYDTGNVGLVGKRAIVQWLDSHWFVGQDDIYSFSASRALERIGTRIIRETVQNPDIDLAETIVSPDPVNERIVFQFFGRSSRIVRDLWCYYYKTGGWSREPFGGTGYFFGRTVHAMAFEDAIGDWKDVEYLDSWTSFEPILSEEKTFTLKGTSMYMYREGATGDREDLSSTTVLPVPVTIESGDFDFGTPNILKTVTQMSVKMERAVEGQVVFEVDVSSNRQVAWKTVGRLVIAATEDEGKVDFRSVGSLFRFRLRTSSVVRRWTMNEIVLVATEVGREHVFV